MGEILRLTGASRELQKSFEQRKEMVISVLQIGICRQAGESTGEARGRESRGGCTQGPCRDRAVQSALRHFKVHRTVIDMEFQVQI